jgi:hypothetical protein
MSGQPINEKLTTITDVGVSQRLLGLGFLRLHSLHREANQTVQRTGASRHAEWRCGRRRWLAPVADLPRWATSHNMKQTEHRGWMWARCALALFMALLFLGSVLPSLGRVVLDLSTTPPTPHIVRITPATLTTVGIAAVPFVLVLIGTFRRSQLAIPGWIMLAVVDVIAFMQ